MFGCPREPKWTPKGSLKSQKSCPRSFIFAFVFPSILRTPLLSNFTTFRGAPNLQNVAKTLYCRSKSKVPPFPPQTDYFWKWEPKWPQNDLPNPPKFPKVPSRTPLQKNTDFKVGFRHQNAQKLLPKVVGTDGPGHLFLLPLTHLRSRWGPDPILAPVCFKKSCFFCEFWKELLHWNDMSDMSNPRSVPKKHHKLLPLGASLSGGGDDPPPGVFNK